MDLDALQECGLTSNESKVYVALVGKRSHTASELAKVSGVPRAIIYRVLDGLMAKGLCTQKSGKTKRFAASDPEEGLGRLLLQKERRLKEAGGVITELKSLYNRGREAQDPLEYIEIIKDPALIQQRYLKHVESVEESVQAFVKGPFVASHLGSYDDQVLSQIRRQRSRPQIHVRTLYEFDIGEILGTEDEDYAHALAQAHRTAHAVTRMASEEARVLPRLPIKAIVFDRAVVLLMLSDPPPVGQSFTTLIIEHRDLAGSLAMLFDFLWDGSLLWERYIEQHREKLEGLFGKELFDLSSLEERLTD